MDLQLAGKTAIITGGSRGIGKAIAAQLAAEGARTEFWAGTAVVHAGDTRLMEKPGVQSAATPDGQRIAYTAEGQGEPYVVVAAVGNVQANRDLNAWNVLAESLTSAHRVLFMDVRGQGLSSAAEAIDLDAWVTDIASVFDAAGIERAVLHSPFK